MSEINKIRVLEALGKVIEPKQNRDLVSLGLIKEVLINSNKITINAELKDSESDTIEKIKHDCYSILSEDIPEADEIKINIISDPSINQNNLSILPGVKNTIAIASGKGGVGKSTVSVNLAIALSNAGARVGLVDADIYGPSIPLMLGINGQPKIYQAAESKKMLPLENYGIKLMSIGFLIGDDNPVIWRGPMASGAIKQFLTDVEWGELDYLILDLPPGTGDIQLTLVQTIPLTGSVIVTTPQDVSLIDARKGLKMFERVNVPVLGIIENMSYFIAPDTGNRYDIFGSGGGKNLAKELNTAFLGAIPIDPRICEGSDTGKPLVNELPDSENSKKFNDIIQNLNTQLDLSNKNSESDEVEIVFNDKN